MPKWEDDDELVVKPPQKVTPQESTNGTAAAPASGPAPAPEVAKSLPPVEDSGLTIGDRATGAVAEPDTLPAQVVESSVADEEVPQPLTKIDQTDQAYLSKRLGNFLVGDGTFDNLRRQSVRLGYC